MTEDNKLDRRQFIQRSALSSGVFLFGLSSPYSAVADNTFAAAKFLGLVDFVDEGPAPVGVPIATELDSRLYTDLSKLTERRVITPTGEFFIRTAASQILPSPDQWTIKVDGLVEQPSELHIRSLHNLARPMGTHLMECAGNVRVTHYGLISVANWAGVPVASIFDRVKPKPEASRVVISGFDHYANPSMTSVPGASWIFRLDDLKETRAFLATEMNSQPLTPDHGAPVRLVVPGWYGCACIKWVNGITFVGDDAEATSQMQEYAARILQEGRPQRAKDYQAATIDHAAMPVRVEKWSMAGKLRYRIVGILWGGTQPVKTLQIRFNPDEDFVPVKGFQQTANDPWTIWTDSWSPKAPGLYSIRLTVTEPQVRTRKLDSGYYVRSVNISEI